MLEAIEVEARFSRERRARCSGDRAEVICWAPKRAGLSVPTAVEVNETLTHQGTHIYKTILGAVEREHK